MAKERINYKLDHPKAIILLLRERSDARKLAGIHTYHREQTTNSLNNMLVVVWYFINMQCFRFVAIFLSSKITAQYLDPTSLKSLTPKPFATKN
jgi:hypothetical protein